MIITKFRYLKVALSYAKGDSDLDEFFLKECVESLQRSGNTLTASEGERFWKIYKDHNGQRTQACLDEALKYAQGNDICDQYKIKNNIESARKFSEAQLSKEVVEHIWDVYRENNPKRWKSCFDAALGYARGKIKVMDARADESIYDLFTNDWIKLMGQFAGRSLRARLKNLSAETFIKAERLRTILSYNEGIKELCDLVSS